jgi:heat shock protein HslJ
VKRHLQFLALLVCGLLALSACAAQSAAKPPAELPVGITWQWVGLTQAQPAGQPVIPDPQNYLLLLNNDFTYAVKADCNSGLGQYTVSGSSLTINPAPLTPTDCGPRSLYAQYGQLLRDVSSYITEGDQLVLILKNNAGRMTFARSAASLGAGGTQNVQIVGVPWHWIETSGRQSLHPESGKYTLILNQDGTYQAKADCNTSGGTYTIEGDKLTLLPGPATLAECGPDSLSQPYLTLLGNAATYSSGGGRLNLTLKADDGTMIFARG